MTRSHDSPLVALQFLVPLGLCGPSSETGETCRRIPPLPGGPRGRVELEMTKVEVRSPLGNPDRSPRSTTGKSWIPFHFGSGPARCAIEDGGIGRVVFSRHRNRDGQKVIRIDHDPNEKGQ